jgi:hypothetical protein
LLHIDNTSQHGWLWYNWGNLASGIGLVVSIIGVFFTVWTLRTAKSARKAATEARDAAEVRSLIDEVRRGELLTRDLASHISARSIEVGSVRARDISDLLGWIVEYWSEDLRDCKQSMMDAKNDIEQANKILFRITGQSEIDDRDFEKASKRVDSAFQSFIRVRATLEKRRKEDGFREQ